MHMDPNTSLANITQNAAAASGDALSGAAVGAIVFVACFAAFASVCVFVFRHSVRDCCEAFSGFLPSDSFCCCLAVNATFTLPREV
jgi:hypothetical protein